MERKSTVENRQTISGYLATLHISHDAAASHYQDIANALKEERAIKTMTLSLANFHRDQARDIKEVLSDMPSIPVKPSAAMVHEMEDVEPKEMDNDVSLLKNYQQREEAFLAYYKEMLDNDGLPEEQYEKLQSISELIQEVVRKIHRTISSGAVETDMTVL